MRKVTEFIDIIGNDEVANHPAGMSKRVFDTHRGIIADAIAVGDFKDSSPYLHTVPLTDDMREIVVTTRHDTVTSRNIDRRYGVQLAAPAQRALMATVAGRHDIWFNRHGSVFISFQHSDDATMFRLALEDVAA